MQPKPVSPQFVKFTDRMALVMPWIGLSIGLGLIGIAIWGCWACRALARSYAVPGAGPNPAVAVLSWLVLFLPVALVGAGLARWVLKQPQVAAAEKRIRVMAESKVEILPPPSIYQGPSIAHAAPAAPHVSQPVDREPLDDATRRRLDELGERVATIFNVGAGLLLLVGGLLGFAVIWIDSHSPRSVGRSVVGFEIRLLFYCGLSVFIGLAILRSAFRKTADTAGLAPLQAFMRIALMRASADEMSRKNKEGPRLGPG